MRRSGAVRPARRPGLVLAFALVVQLVACEHRGQVAPPGGDPPRQAAAAQDGKVAPFAFELDPKGIDLGMLRPDQDAACAFEIVNRDARPLRIQKLVGSCECTTFTWEPTPIAPGERRKVKVDVRAQNRGSKLLTIWAQAADDAVTTRQVDISYVVLAELAFDPPQLAFGRRVVGADAEADVVVRYRVPFDHPPLELAPRLSQELPLTWTFAQPEVTDLAGKVRDVKVRLHFVLDGAKPVKAFQAGLVFESKLHGPARLAVSGEIHSGWYLDREQVHLGVVKLGAKGRATVRLCYTSDPPTIEGLEPSAPELTATSSSEPGERALKIGIVFEPTKSGEFEGEVRVRIDKSAEPLVIQVKAKVR
jgi:hypothetical protein